MKTIIAVIVLLAFYGGSLVWKNQGIVEKNNKYIPTTYDLQKKDGIPVKVSSVEKGKFQEFITISGTIKQGVLKSSVAPFVRQKLRIGEPARLDLDAGMKQVFGKVSSISGSQNYLTGLYEVTVTFSRGLPGDLGAVTVDIPIKEVDNVLIVPREAVSAREKNPIVFVLENNKLNKKTVQIAGANSEVYWIKSGLKQDEVVITSDTRYFTGGELVKVMNATRNNL